LLLYYTMITEGLGSATKALREAVSGTEPGQTISLDWDSLRAREMVWTRASDELPSLCVE
jgi:hypothetical protein